MLSAQILPVNIELDDEATGKLEILGIASPVDELKYFTKLSLIIVTQSTFCTNTCTSHAS